MHLTTIVTMLISAALALPLAKEPDVVALRDRGNVDAPVNTRATQEPGTIVYHDVGIADE